MAAAQKQLRSGQAPKAPESRSRMMITPPTEAAPRLLPSTELPGYTYVPGTDTPHPYRDARGHSYQRKSPTPKMLTASNWAENRHYLLALDYFKAKKPHKVSPRARRNTGPSQEVEDAYILPMLFLSAPHVRAGHPAPSGHGPRRQPRHSGEPRR